MLGHIHCALQQVSCRYDEKEGQNYVENVYVNINIKTLAQVASCRTCDDVQVPTALGIYVAVRNSGLRA